MRLRGTTTLLTSLIAVVGSPAAVTEAATPPQRVLLLNGGQVVPIYPVSGAAPTTHVGFIRDEKANTLSRVDQNGAPLSESPTSTTLGNSLFGGFDYDQDGWPDVAERVVSWAGWNCANGAPVMSRFIRIFSGRRDEVHAPVSALPDTCTGGDPVHAWGPFHPLFGSGPELAFAPQLYNAGWFMTHDPGSGFATNGTFWQPNGDWWTGTYTGVASPHNTDQSNVFNGLIATVSGERRLIAWTTKRAMQFRTAGYPQPAPGQLVADHRYVGGSGTACGPYVSGRNYGLVIRDPASGYVNLLAGTDAFTVFDDMKNDVNAPLYAQLNENNPASDPWGQLERHVSVYDPQSQSLLSDRFVWCATAATPREWKYWGRLIYPANPLVERTGPSRLAYNIFGDFRPPGGDSSLNRWVMQITYGGSATPQIKLRDWFLWDIRDIDADGRDEWIASPACDPVPPEGCEGSVSDPPYLLAHKTFIFHWNEQTQWFDPHAQVIEGAYPYLTRTLRGPTASTTREYLRPVLSVDTPGGLRLLVTQDGITPQPAVDAQPTDVLPVPSPGFESPDVSEPQAPEAVRAAASAGGVTRSRRHCRKKGRVAVAKPPRRCRRATSQR